MKIHFKSLTGMADIMPEDQFFWKKIEEVVISMANFYHFLKITPPILEEEKLFIKGTGETTEVVEKQMYSFRTKGRERIVLRPEFTPAIVRAYLEKGMKNWTKPVRLWSLGPVFRYEKPQKGRHRQFHQFNFEILDSSSPAIDTLLIQLFLNIFKILGFRKPRLEINSIGCKECRSPYKIELKNYYKKFLKEICSHCKRRFGVNPLRLLDCKEEKCQSIKKSAPKIMNFLCEDCTNHFKNLEDFLKEAEITYYLNHHLVRGLDYYNRTVFEIFPDEKENQNALVGGGRYDYLVEKLGGEPTPAIGGAAGIERIIEEIKEREMRLPKDIKSFEEKPKVFLIQLGISARKKIFTLIEEFKKNKIKISENISKDSLKSQLKLADKAKTKYSLILGQKEAIEDTIILRNMETGIQKVIPFKNAIKEIKKRLKSN